MSLKNKAQEGRIINKLSSVTPIHPIEIMVDDVQQYLVKHGPSRSSLIVETLVSSGLTPEAARQRVSRSRKPVRRFPIPMLPKREAFLYLEQDRNSDRFWNNFIRDLRATGSVFGVALDGMIARGGLLRREDFATISSAPTLPVHGQLSVEVVAKRMLAAGFMDEVSIDDVIHYRLPLSLAHASEVGLRARDLTERILLDGIREWARKIGLVSFNSVRIRTEPDWKPIGPFTFDLAGPSYLLALKGPGKPGFLVADVFAEGILSADEVQYFIRKAKMLKSTLKDIGVLSIIIAEGFSGEALRAGHAAGIAMATPKELFGKRIGAAITSLVEVLKSAAAYASYSPDRLMVLMDNLFQIEGRNANLRGVLFELVAGYLARRDAVSIDMNCIAKDQTTGKTAEIDILKVTSQSVSVTCIECKGKEPGGSVTVNDVQEWLKKIPTIRAHLRNHYSFREAEQRFELWTSGKIDTDAMELLQREKAKRKKAPIDWKDGQSVLAMALEGKEKGIADALKQHFIRHPFADNYVHIDEAGFSNLSLSQPTTQKLAPSASSSHPEPKRVEEA